MNPTNERDGLADMFDMCRQLIQEAKGAEGPNGGFVTNHLDDAENWLDKIEALTAAAVPAEASEGEVDLKWQRLRDAARELLDGSSRTYKARNGRTMSIEADDGEACDIVHSDLTYALRSAIEKLTSGGSHG